MFSVDLSTSECDGYVVVALRGELDIAGAAAALAAVAARKPDIAVDLAGLEFIDSSGVPALARRRKHAWHAGGDLLLAAPQQQVLRVLTLTRLLRETVLPPHARFCFGRSGPARTSAATRRPGKCRSPPVTGSAGWPNPAGSHATNAA